MAIAVRKRLGVGRKVGKMLSDPETGLSQGAGKPREALGQEETVCTAPLGWVLRPSATLRLSLRPRASPGTRQHTHGCGAPAPRASHQACVVPIRTLRLLHHAGEAAGTGRGAGDVLQHLCSLDGCVRSAQTPSHQPPAPGLPGACCTLLPAQSLPQCLEKLSFLGLPDKGNCRRVSPL